MRSPAYSAARTVPGTSSGNPARGRCEIDWLQPQRPRVLHVSSLGKHLKDRGPEPIPRRRTPLGHLGVTSSTIQQIVFPANLAKAYLPPVGTEDGRTGPRRGRDVLPIV